MNYDAFLIMAQKQIDDKGRSVSLVARNKGAYDPITNTMADNADTLKQVDAVFTEYSAKDIDGEVIQRADKMCLVAGSVEGFDYIVDGDSEYKIVNVQAIQPGAIVVMSKVQVRR